MLLSTSILPAPVFSMLSRLRRGTSRPVLLGALVAGLLGSVGLWCPHPVVAQGASEPGEAAGELIEVLPVGTFHFASAPDFNDPMAPEQQAGIQAIVDSLLDFRPTKVAVEREVEDSARVDSLY